MYFVPSHCITLGLSESNWVELYIFYTCLLLLKVRVGMVPKECDSLGAVELKESEQKQNAVLDKLDTILANQASTATVLKYMRWATVFFFHIIYQ